jgi:hypothetical protein
VHACSTGLSTGRRLMPMTARCCAAAPCLTGQKLSELPHTRQVVGSCWLCGSHERVQLQRHSKLVAIQTEACPAMSSTQPANALHALLCAIHTVSLFHSVALETPVQLSGLPRVFVHALAFSSTPSHADAAEFSSTPSHAAAVARALCSFHHSPRVRQLSDSHCSAAQRGRTAPSRHGHQTTSR